jgi:CrcB protein
MIRNILLVGFGGGIGSIARYLCQRWMTIYYPLHFSWATFAVNVLGCLLIGIFWGLSLRSTGFTNDWKLFFMTGLCGGFTTFSSFTQDGIGLLKENRTGLFFLYIAGSVVAGLFATYLGLRLAK